MGFFGEKSNRGGIEIRGKAEDLISSTLKMVKPGEQMLIQIICRRDYNTKKEVVDELVVRRLRDPGGMVNESLPKGWEQFETKKEEES